MGQISDKPQPAQYSDDEVLDALNRAADLVEPRAMPLIKDLATDLVNLMVNAVVHLLDHPDDTLADVVAAQYDLDHETPEQFLSEIFHDATW
ncbi:MAG: hypothetical protein LBG60_04965 [Bifidobacteriaceae bacterium]|jgi:hypothetical protein|nr:hypothetical protein [Bifidobacteriaceae bacterium]